MSEDEGPYVVITRGADGRGPFEADKSAEAMELDEADPCKSINTRYLGCYAIAGHAGRWFDTHLLETILPFRSDAWLHIFCGPVAWKSEQGVCRTGSPRHD